MRARLSTRVAAAPPAESPPINGRLFGRDADLARIAAELERPGCVTLVGAAGVGKTSLTINLAVAMARLGHRVGILDADFGLGNIDVLDKAAWATLIALVIKTIVQTVLSYVMRLKFTPTAKIEDEKVHLEPVPVPVPPKEQDLAA